MLNLLKNLNPLVKKQSLNIRLGLWGTVGSGKTTYLTMLLHCLEKHPEWIVTPEPNFLPIVRENITKIIDQRRFPSSTKNTSGEIQIFSYTLMPRNLMSREKFNITLRFIDAPGEFYENLNVDARVIETKHQDRDIVDYLMSCDGIIFLLDPKRFESNQENSKSYHELLIDLFDEFKYRYNRNPPENQEKNQENRLPFVSNLLPQYLAFCVTKIDEKIKNGDDEKEEIDLWKEAEKPLELVQKIMGRELFDCLNNFCHLDLHNPDDSSRNRCNFYGISSIGRYLENTEFKEAVIHSEVNPHQSHSEEDLFQTQKEQETPKDSESKQSKEAWASNLNSERWANPENKPESEAKSYTTIKSGVNLEPVNVVAPIEWLIRRIQAYPPFPDR